ncbi:MAG: hypothetical protein IPO25_22835 [Saprospiraceae bacterium]|nr:hypothetical protein [Saprospiraceae bacterium]
MERIIVSCRPIRRQAPDPDNVDSDDNGTLKGNPVFPGAVFSDPRLE